MDDSDPQSIQYGNPNLDIVTHHTFYLNWVHLSQQWNFFLGGTASFTPNDILRILPFNDSGIYESTYYNIGHRQLYRINGSISLKKRNKYSFSTSFNTTYSVWNAETIRSQAGFTYYFLLNGNVNLWKNGLFHFNGSYSSPSFDIQRESSATWSYSFGLRQTLYKEKISLALNIRNLFDAHRTQTINRNGVDFISRSQQTTDLRHLSSILAIASES